MKIPLSGISVVLIFKICMHNVLRKYSVDVPALMYALNGNLQFTNIAKNGTTEMKKRKFVLLCHILSTKFCFISDVFVPGHVHGYSLKNLLPGNYDIFMRANTDTGAGAAGPIINVHIGEDRTHT